MSLAAVLGEDARCTDPQDDSLYESPKQGNLERPSKRVWFPGARKVWASLPSDKDVLKTTVAMAVYMCEYTKIY